MGGSIIEETELRSARMLSGLSVQDAAMALLITEHELNHYEVECESVPAGLAVRMAKLYRLSIDEIRFCAKDV